jgi:probable F420-dependent oxidoreductase
MPDHFGDQFAPAPALMAAADATTSLRIGTLIWDNDFRHPVVLAKEAATLDVLSGGRLEFGIGAGWMKTDYEQSGITYDPPKVRIERLAETVTICKGLWGPREFSFQGSYYTVTSLDGSPKPYQQPGPPVLIGGGGPKILSLAVAQADIVSINPNMRAGAADGSTAGEFAPGTMDKKIDHMRTAAGARWSELEVNVLVFGVNIGPAASGMRQPVADQLGMGVADLGLSPYMWFGSAPEVADQLRVIRERWGISYFAVMGEPAVEQAAAVVAELAGT